MSRVKSFLLCPLLDGRKTRQKKEGLDLKTRKRVVEGKARKESKGVCKD